MGQLPVICTAVGGEGMFYGPVTARQICDITIMHCHGGLSLKAQCIEFQLHYCGWFFLFLSFREGLDILNVLCHLLLYLANTPLKYAKSLAKPIPNKIFPR